MTEPTTQPRPGDQTAPRREQPGDPSLQVRAEDLEPYVGLRYLSRLFKLMAVILILLMAAEIITGLVAQGTAAIPTLLAEVSRLIVLAGLLWGTGDLAILVIDLGHDVRAARILLGRLASHRGETRSPASDSRVAPR